MEQTPQYLVALLRYTTQMHTDMLDHLSDADLGFRVPGNPTLGEVCREMGNVERCYLESFKTRKLTWGIQRDDTSQTAASLEKLKAWYEALDEEFASALLAIPESDFQAMTVERSGRSMPAGLFYYNYHEALLIFCARCSVYLRMMGIQAPIGFGRKVIAAR